MRSIALDLYMPVGTVQNAPVVLFMYGGGKREGDKSHYVAFSTIKLKAFCALLPGSESSSQCTMRRAYSETRSMTVVHAASRSATGRQWLLRFALAFFTTSSLAQEPIAAVFKARDVDFLYRSSTNEYACDELRNRVANILLAVGARDDIDVRITDCDLSLIPGRSRAYDPANTWSRSNPSSRFDTRSGGDQTAHVRVRLMMPVEATPEVLAELDKDRSRRELLSRVTGNPTAMFNEPAVFAAQRQQVTLSRRTIRLEPEDCELLDEMISSVFRELDVRVVRRNFTCDPRQFSRISPQLTVEVLLPAGATSTPPSGAAPSAPAESESEPSEPEKETPPQ